MNKATLLSKCLGLFDEKIEQITKEMQQLQERMDMLKKCRTEFLYDFTEAYIQEEIYPEAPEAPDTLTYPDELTYWDGDITDPTYGT